MIQTKKPKILLAFSGGLDTSAIIPWLKEHYNGEVLAYCADCGNAPDEQALRKWALELGACELIYEDLKDTFTENYVSLALRANAVYQDDYLLGTALSRPLIAQRMAYFAKSRNVQYIAHGATGKGNDQIRFEKSWAYLVPDIEIIAPWKLWPYTGRADLNQYLAGKGLPLQSEEKKYSVDVNLFHRSTEGDILENPADEYDPKEVYKWVTPPGEQNHDSRIVKLQFKNGFATHLNDEYIKPSELLSQLNKLAGAAGVGVLDLVEGRANGIKSRGLYETPGGTLLHFCIKSLKHLCWDRNLMNISRNLAQQFGELIYDGDWHSSSTQAILAFFAAAAKTLSGTIKLRLQNGHMTVLERSSKYSLYDEMSVTFESDNSGLHKHSLGYCKTITFNNHLAGLRDQRNGNFNSEL